jgi:hypothetical protein
MHSDTLNGQHAEILVLDYLMTAVYLVLTQSVFLLIRIDYIYITQGNIQRKN